MFYSAGGKVMLVRLAADGSRIGVPIPIANETAREVQSSVRTRAECLRPVAAGATPDTTGTLCDTAPGT